MSGWTDDRIERARSMWTAGASASQIAEALGGVTRNAVIGLVHRKGWSGGGAGTVKIDWSKERREELRRMLDAGASRAAMAAKFGVTEAAIGNRVRRMLKADGKPPRPRGRPPAGVRPCAPRLPRLPRPPRPVRIVHVGPPPPSRDLPLVALTDATCKWPYGDGAPFLFCGAPTEAGRPYCNCHYSLATRRAA